MKLTKSTASFFRDIDHAILHYTTSKIEDEKSKELEELIFFSSYTIQFNVFEKATQKLKKILRKKELLEHPWIYEDTITVFLKDYELSIDTNSDRYTYFLYAFLKAQIEINETVMRHFMNLCKRAHSLDYIESRAQAIYHLLFDE